MPWRLIAGSRDKLIHAYFEVDWRIVWSILQNEIPVLETGVQTILADLDTQLEETG
ncbi:MAG: HepT-like ribonuclease domain-containing protein [Methanoculleus sp.]